MYIYLTARDCTACLVDDLSTLTFRAARQKRAHIYMHTNIHTCKYPFQRSQQKAEQQRKKVKARTKQLRYQWRGRIYIYIYECTHTHTHTYTHAHTYASWAHSVESWAVEEEGEGARGAAPLRGEGLYIYTHTQTHTRTHTHTHTYTHTCKHTTHLHTYTHTSWAHSAESWALEEEGEGARGAGPLRGEGSGKISYTNRDPYCHFQKPIFKKHELRNQTNMRGRGRSHTPIVTIQKKKKRNPMWDLVNKASMKRGTSARIATCTAIHQKKKWNMSSCIGPT